MSTSRQERAHNCRGRPHIVAEPQPAVAQDEPLPPQPRFVFFARRQFLWKTLLLLATTIALIPILLWKQLYAAEVYLVALIVVHVAGIAIVAIGVKRDQIAPDRRGLVIRLVGITLLVALLWLAAQGLDPNGATGWIFWGSLFAIWALHTAGLALLHIRSGREQSFCPFV